MKNKINSIYKRYGVIGIIENGLLKVVSLFGFKDLQLLRLLCRDIDFKSIPSDFEIIQLHSNDFKRCQINDKNWITDDYINIVERRVSHPQKNYECYGICINNVIASYAWISLNLEPKTEMPMEKESSFIFDVYTNPTFRGKKLFPITLAFLLKRLNSLGKKQVYACVDIYNRASLKAFSKVGFKQITKFFTWKKKGKTISTLKNSL